MRPVIMSTSLIYALENVLFYEYIPVVIMFCLHIVHKVMNNNMSQIRFHYYLYTYINHGHIWHRNKLSRCQMELLVSCSNDEHQTSLKWDSSSHPVAPECRVSHTVGLKHFTVLQWMLCETLSLTLNVPAAWHAGCNVRYKLSRRFCKRVIYFAYIDS